MFTIDPAGQCRECLEIFWSQDQHGSHLKDGKCIKLEKQRRERELDQARRELQETERELHTSRPKSQEASTSSVSSAPVMTVSRSRSPSPNIVWKPLPKPGDTKWRAVGSESRNVYQRSPSPPARNKTANIDVPKYMMDGKTAYFICKLCQEPGHHFLL